MDLARVEYTKLLKYCKVDRISHKNIKMPIIFSNFVGDSHKCGSLYFFMISLWDLQYQVRHSPASWRLFQGSSTARV